MIDEAHNIAKACESALGNTIKRSELISAQEALQKLLNWVKNQPTFKKVHKRPEIGLGFLSNENDINLLIAIAKEVNKFVDS